jgi:iron-only hydrogenase group A
VARLTDPAATAALAANHACPLLNLVEIDGRVAARVVVGGMPVRAGMELATASPLIEAALAECLADLRERGVCGHIACLQDFVAGEANQAGFIDLERRVAWDFETRRSGPSILHDPNACVRCQACVDTCSITQNVGALSFDEELGIVVDEELCVRCGQCTLACPVGARSKTDYFAEVLGCQKCPYARPQAALREVDDTERVLAAIDDPEIVVVAQFAPAVRASLGEEFGLPPGDVVTGRLYAGLRRLGVNHVWDTNFAADLTIMEEGSELLERVKSCGVLPQFTSCSPGWIRFCETRFPELIPNLSSAKSPQQMFGAVAKTFAAERLGVDPRKMFVLSLMPCTAKKTEAARTEMTDAWSYWREKGKNADDEPFFDVDAVLTNRETARLLKLRGVDLAAMPDEGADPLLGEYTGAAPIFGRTGGVMEAALRTAYELITGETLNKLEFEALRGLEGVKTAMIQVGDLEVKVAVAHGLANAQAVCESVKMAASSPAITSSRSWPVPEDASGVVAR